MALKLRNQIHINIDQGGRLVFYTLISLIIRWEREMIILRIPRRVNDRDLRKYILNQIKKFRWNKRRKHVKSQGEVAYSQDYVYFVSLIEI